MKNEGKLKEDEMIHFLNNHKVSDLSQNLYSMLRILYGVLDPDSIVKCEYGIENTKPDFVITIDGKSKYVSMKSGRAICVHGEQIQTFIPFLRSIGVSKDTLRTILLYHFGDGTLDGSGKERWTADFTTTKYRNLLVAANEELNHPDIAWQIMERMLFVGVDPEVPPADSIYFGDYSYGAIATKKQIYKRFQRDLNRWRNLRNIHVGPIIFKPQARYAGEPVRNEKSRNRIIATWINLREDIEYISRHYDSYTPIRHRTYEE